MLNLVRPLNRRSALRSEEGATLVEFTLIAGFFFFFILATIELLRLALISLTIQFVSTIETRNSVVSGRNAALIQQDVQNSAGRFMVALSPGDITVSSQALTFPTGTGWEPNSAGGPGDLISIRVDRQVNLVLPVFPPYTLTGFAIGFREQ